MVDKETILTY